MAHDPNLVAITSKEGSDLLIIHATIDGPFANLETVHVNDGQDSSRFLRVDVLGSMPSAANGELIRTRSG